MLQDFANLVWASPVNLACYVAINLFFGGFALYFLIRSVASIIRHRRDYAADRRAIMARRALPWHQR